MSFSWNRGAFAAGGRYRMRRPPGRLVAAGMTWFCFCAGASTAAGQDCLPVKGWAILEHPVRLCAYLTDPASAAACESRGFRLAEGMDENRVRVALQSLMLCADEYVIGVNYERSAGDSLSRLAVTTALISERDKGSSYYDHGRVRILVHHQGNWAEETVYRWEE